VKKAPGGQRRVLSHRLGGVAGDAEGAGQEDVHLLGEVRHRQALALAVDRPAAGVGRRRSAVNDHRRPQRSDVHRGLHRLGDRGLVHDVGADIDRAVAQLLGQDLAAFVRHVGDDHPRALLRHRR
jgi:hypothetical protein